MNVDLKEKEGLTQIDRIFYSEVKQSVINVVSDNPDLDEVRLREKILEIIVKYFDKTIGIEKLGVMLSARGCFSDPVRFLEDSKRKYLAYYSTHPIPLVNSKATLQKIAVIAEELEKKIDEALKDTPKRFGFCHWYWATKRRILMEDYGITWYSPAECNPDIMYD